MVIRICILSHVEQIQVNMSHKIAKVFLELLLQCMEKLKLLSFLRNNLFCYFHTLQKHPCVPTLLSTSIPDTAHKLHVLGRQPLCSRPTVTSTSNLHMPGKYRLRIDSCD